MNHSNSTSNGLLILSDNVMRVENAIIDEVYTNTNRNGYILVSYGMPVQENQPNMNQIRLNISKGTMIISEFGEALSINDLEKGMRIDAEFSSAFTRSIPPQTNTYRIIVLFDLEEEDVTVDRVVEVDTANAFLLTGNPYDMYDQMRFNVSDTTEILDSNGMAIPLNAITPGKMVKVEHAIFQTMSIPPQSPAYRIQLL